MMPFRVVLQTLPDSTAESPAYVYQNLSLKTVAVVGVGSYEPLPISFEKAFENLSRLPSMFVEGDGSFTWGSVSGESPQWRVDGGLFDRDGRLVYVELKGTCPREAWHALMECLNPTNRPLMVQWLEVGIHTSEIEFRKLLECGNCR